jgi:GntR family transcriptional regulator of abcA and norABC
VGKSARWSSPWLDDQRVLFRRIVDDILDQIEQGALYPNAPLPSARKMAEIYGVGVMTVQRALRELQQLRVTYSIAGKARSCIQTSRICATTPPSARP